MKPFIAKTFTLPALKGISAKTNEEHLKLYAGYIKNANLVLDTLEQLKKDLVAGKTSDKDTYFMGELNRRFAFEFNGVRNHEIYFSSLQGGAKALESAGALRKAIEAEFGTFDAWLSSFKSLAMTRGIGWAVLWYDHKDKRLYSSWVDEQHLGQLNDCAPLLALDMWEHSYVADYQPSGKKQYIEDYFANLDWTSVEKNYSEAQ